MLENLMRHTVTVNRPTPSKGTSGGEKDTYAAVYTSLPCLVQPVTATWLAQYSRKAIDVSHSVYFGNSNPTILNGDQLVFGSITLLGKGARDLQFWQKVLVADCQQIT